MSDDGYKRPEGGYLGKVSLGNVMPSGGDFGKGCLVVVALVLLVLALSAIAFVSSWCSAVAKVVSPENVTGTWDFAYKYEKSLNALATQDCNLLLAVNRSTSDTEAQNRRSQELAVSQQYSNAEAAYDAKLANAFQGKFVKPPDVPSQAPTLDQALLRTKCAVNSSGLPWPLAGPASP